MRPDLDDFEEMNQDPAAEPRSRAMSWLVLSVAVIGFAALAYYAYESGTRSLDDSDILVVDAEQGDIKTAPAEPGGEEFPHQDKTIYDALTGDESAQKVEKLLPETEEAVMPDPAPAKEGPSPAKEKTTTFVNEAVSSADEEEEDISAAAEKATSSAKPSDAMPATTIPAAPEPTVAETPSPAAPAPEKSAVKSSGSYKIQLGAFSSETEAQTNWNRIAKKYSGTVKGAPIIVRADLPSGTFYRLRASGFASAADAKAACAKLSAAGQACFYAGK